MDHLPSPPDEKYGHRSASFTGGAHWATGIQYSSAAGGPLTDKARERLTGAPFPILLASAHSGSRRGADVAIGIGPGLDAGGCSLLVCCTRSLLGVLDSMWPGREETGLLWQKCAETPAWRAMCHVTRHRGMVRYEASFGSSVCCLVVWRRAAAGSRWPRLGALMQAMQMQMQVGRRAGTHAVDCSRRATCILHTSGCMCAGGGAAPGRGVGWTREIVQSCQPAGRHVVSCRLDLRECPAKVLGELAGAVAFAVDATGSSLRDTIRIPGIFSRNIDGYSGGGGVFRRVRRGVGRWGWVVMR